MFFFISSTAFVLFCSLSFASRFHFFCFRDKITWSPTIQNIISTFHSKMKRTCKSKTEQFFLYLCFPWNELPTFATVWMSINLVVVFFYSSICSFPQTSLFFLIPLNHRTNEDISLIAIQPIDRVAFCGSIVKMIISISFSLSGNFGRKITFLFSIYHQFQVFFFWEQNCVIYINQSFFCFNFR